MGVKLILVCKEKAVQQAYLMALEPFGIQIDIVASPAKLYQRMTKTAYNGVLVDLKTKLQASDRAKAVIRDAVEQFPVVQLKWDHSSGDIRSFHFGRSRAGGTLEAFIDEECRPFKARSLRKSTRRTAHFNVQLNKCDKSSERAPIPTVTLNVSRGGCFLYAIDRWQIDTAVKMVIKELGDQTPIGGSVRWIRSWGERMQIPGIGVQFEMLGPDQLKEICKKANLPESRS